MSPGRYGVLWRYPRATQEELARARLFLETRHGPDALTGKVFGRTASVKGILEDPTVPRGCWLVELKESEPS